MSDQLRVPGPTPLPDSILQAMTKQMIDHRGPEFGRIMNGLTANLKTLFQTRNDILLLTGSGTGGMEAAIVNMLSPGEKVLAVSIGDFGNRFASMAKQFGAEVIPLNVEWGQPAEPDAIRKALQADPQITTVLITHNETSTGVTNDLAAISKAVKEFDKLLIVDAISSLGSIDLPVDQWNIDVALSGSQKGWMAPPGVAMVSVSPAAWQAHAKARMPRFYWDFTRAKSYAEKGQTPWTPAVTTIYAMAASLELMVKDGLPNIVARHARVGKAAREGVKSLGLSLFANEKYASNTVTAVRGDGLDVKKLRQTIDNECHVVLAGGQGKLDGQIFRIGHLGWVSEEDIKGV
ncbi:MAG: alanine--glyoxylate aminotransferase family protein, partial [Chloroflexi bacterium]|nr:alanine--glyoxylate aminotransferase family protein [Chloroflexota bacterium]